MGSFFDFFFGGSVGGRGRIFCFRGEKGFNFCVKIGLMLEEIVKGVMKKIKVKK